MLGAAAVFRVGAVLRAGMDPDRRAAVTAEPPERQSSDIHAAGEAPARARRAERQLLGAFVAARPFLIPQILVPIR
ncbi:MAG: hypothetical protein JNK67_13260 [Alphaproteobacteria bacterium]|nr:hypothetical protein [Alphaproteobacteria bacterium]